MDVGKKILLFLTKAITFSVVFWCSWIFIFRQIPTNPTEVIPLTSDDFGKELDKIYEQQLKKVGEHLVISELHQKKMERLIEKYEDHVQRYEKVLQKWEQQTGLKK
jgi:hypothetical protein